MEDSRPVKQIWDSNYRRGKEEEDRDKRDGVVGGEILESRGDKKKYYQ